MRHRRTIPVAVLLALFALPACDDTDVPADAVREPGEEREEMNVEVEPVDLDTVAWFTEGRTVTFEGRTYTVAGEPVYDPAVEPAGEFEGTPLFAEVGVAGPYPQLFVPLENDYWQLLERAPAAGAGETGESQDTGRVEGR